MHMSMLHDLSEYPATKQGAEALTEATRLLVADMWKSERVKKSDDVVAIFNAANNSIRVDTRDRVYRSIQGTDPEHSFLKHLKKPPPSKAGNVTIWSLVTFGNGRICILPLTIARS